MKFDSVGDYNSVREVLLHGEIVLLSFEAAQVFTGPYPEVRLPVFHIGFKVRQCLAHSLLYIQRIFALYSGVHLDGIAIDEAFADVLFVDTVEDGV